MEDLAGEFFPEIVEQIKDLDPKRLKETGKSIRSLSLPEFAEFTFGFKNSKLQKEIYKALIKYSDVLAIIPRGHSKSVCFTQVYPAWRLIHDPRWEIIVGSNKYDLAIGSVQVVQQVLEAYGEKPKSPKKWSQAGIQLDRPFYSRNPSYLAISDDTKVTGVHSDILIGDDFVTRETTATELRRKKLNQFFRGDFQNFLKPTGGQTVICGNHWHYSDLYCDLKKEKHWFKIFHRAVIDWDKKIVLWPEFWSWKRLMERLEKVGSLTFQCQYQNDPSGVKGEYFDTDWIQYYKKLPKGQLTIIQAWDFAESISDRADYTVCVTLARDKEGNFYIIDVLFERFTVTEKFEAIQEMYHEMSNRKFTPDRIIVEKSTFQKEIAVLAADYASLPLDYLQVPTSQSKEDRIVNGLSTFFKRGKIFLPEDCGWERDFEEEYINFPNARHVDILDALELGIRSIREVGTGPQFIGTL